jgi:teichuronic acid biosynthesis glycosyltransferase TuaG
MNGYSMKEIEYFFSVVIPTFNASKSIKNALDSLCLQTFKDFDVYIVDGGSTDNTESVVSDYRDKLNLKFIRNDNDTGPSSARSLGINLSSSPYIAFLDSDDIWLPEKSAKQVKFIKENGADFTYTKVRVVNLDTMKVSRSRHCRSNYSYNNYLKTRGIVSSSVMIKKSLLSEDILSTEIPHSGEETLWWLLIFKKFGCKAYLCDKEPLVHYIFNKNNLSSNQLRTVKQQWKTIALVCNQNIILRTYFYLMYLKNTLSIKIWLRILPWKNYEI